MLCLGGAQKHISSPLYCEDSMPHCRGMPGQHGKSGWVGGAAIEAGGVQKG